MTQDEWRAVLRHLEQHHHRIHRMEAKDVGVFKLGGPTSAQVPEVTPEGVWVHEVGNPLTDFVPASALTRVVVGP